MDDDNQINWNLFKGAKHGERIDSINEANYYQHNNFERMALKFIKHYTSNESWEHTQITHDNNHDGFMIISCYQRGSEEHWVEAKYTYTNKTITRYKLDSTVVSALISNHNVSHIYFVSNSIFPSDVRSDLRIAVSRSNNVNTIEFFDKKALEIWLASDVEYIKEFFTQEHPSITHSSQIYISDAVITEGKKLIFSPSLNFLAANHLYYAKFTIISPNDENLIISPNCNVTIFSKLNLKIFKGANDCEIQFSVGNGWINNTRNICTVTRKSETNETLEILSSIPLSIVSKNTLSLDISSQKAAIKNILDLNEKQGAKIHLLFGSSATGKSYTAIRIIDTLNIISRNITFSNDNISNTYKIIHIILFVLYPYIHPDDLFDYKDNLSNSMFISIFTLIDYLKARNEKEIARLINEELSIDFNDFSGRKSAILIDDIQKLNEINLLFLNKVLFAIKQSRLDITLILNAREDILDTKNPLLQNIEVSKYNLSLSINDISNIFQQKFKTSFKGTEELFQKIIDNIIVLYEFLNIFDNLDDGNTNNDILTRYMLFVRSDAANNLIYERFQQLSEHEHSLLNNIYFSLDGCVRSESKDELKLIKEGLIKIEGNRVIPIHDYYQNLYIKKYLRGSWKDLDEYSKITYNLLYGSIEQKISSANDIQQCLFTDFRKSYKVLNPIFNNEQHKLLAQQICSETYYDLYYNYAYACMNYSSTNYGINELKTIQLELIHYSSLWAKIMIFDCLSHELEYYFSALDYNQADECYKKFEIMLNECTDTGIKYNLKIQKFKFLVDILKIYMNEARGISSLLEFSTLQQNNNDLMLKSEINRRYANYTIHLNYTQAKELNIEAMKIADSPDCNKTKKLDVLLNFQKCYLEYLENTDKKNLDNLIKCYNNYKEIIPNNYLRASYGIALIYYSQNNLKMGDEYLASSILQRRTITLRDTVYKCQLFAMRYLCVGDEVLALEELKIANKTVNIMTYNSIISHNINIIKSKKFSFKKIEFARSKQLKLDYYYIDPRIMH